MVAGFSAEALCPSLQPCSTAHDALRTQLKALKAQQQISDSAESSQCAVRERARFVVTPKHQLAGNLACTQRYWQWFPMHTIEHKDVQM